MENITAETFVHWLNSRLNDPATELPTIFDITDMLNQVALGESITTQAVREHEKLTALTMAGFTRKEAMQLVMNERAAFIKAAVGGMQDNEE